MDCKNLVSDNIPACINLKESLKNGKVLLSLPIPKVISFNSILFNFSFFKIPTQSKISFIISDGFCSFLSSFKSFGFTEFTALSASSTKGCACAKSSSATFFSAAIRFASTWHNSRILPTASDSFLAFIDDFCNCPNIRVVASSALLSFKSSCAKPIFISSTSSAPFSSFSKPVPTLIAFNSNSFILLEYKEIYVFINLI
mmetsp:Transcript_41540/g.53586  ORF Transcript_41540/g.53586 Transcript_41540/m.53586 type:complete len:200 (-) Transcript_41540:152-751(-)